MGFRVHQILALFAAYLLGSIPFGVILTRLGGAGDLRAIGSGNIGATNVLRTGRKGLAAATLLLDAAKGFCAVGLAWRFWPDAVVFAAAGAMIGHCFPVWLGFRGGKGVATLLGIGLGLAWPIGLIAALTWLAVLALVRISSVSGMSSAVAAPLVALVTGHTLFAPVLAALALLVVYQHRANIARLRAGAEPKVGSKS
jgi:glycerol-3-phosphate acyltransferase PlsY